MATIVIHESLKKFTGDRSEIEVKGSILIQALEELATRFPELKRMLVDDHGRIRKDMNVFIGSSDIRQLQQEQTLISETAVISIMPAEAVGE